MTPKQREQKMQYERIREIRFRMEKGKPTTYRERLSVYIYDKRQRKKQREQKQVV